jgi:OFA family oxalate/formate antiporter-like MFS transporter
MSDGKVMNRWLVVVGAILIQLCLGAIYAWSVFTPALTATTPADVAAIYSETALGIGPAQLDNLRADMEMLDDQLRSARKEFAGDDQAQELKEAEDKIVADMQAAAEEYGVVDRVGSLQYKMSKTQTQAVFSAGLALFAIVMVIAGRMMPTLGPQKLAMAGGVVLGLGYLLAGLIAPGSFWSTFLFVGIVGGSGIGLGYVVPIAVGMKWFPDKKGLITGLAVAGFGFGALLWVKLAGGWGHLIAELGLATTFVIYGIAFAVLCLIGALWMVNPPEGYKPEGWEPPQAASGGKPAAGSVDFTSGEMLATPQFYMIFLCFVFGAGAGLMSIGLMKLFPSQALENNGYSVVEASAIAGTAMAVFFSLANGIGRIAWGTLSDVLGRKLSIFVMLATQGVLVICFQWMAGTVWLLYLGAALIGFNFGGNFALFPTITADTFGTKYIGQNYGWVFLSYGIGGIFGPMLGGWLGDLGNFPMAFNICGALVLLAAVLIAMVRPPEKPAAA